MNPQVKPGFEHNDQPSTSEPVWYDNSRAFASGLRWYYNDTGHAIVVAPPDWCSRTR